jgi:hypothetical protein
MVVNGWERFNPEDVSPLCVNLPIPPPMLAPTDEDT